MKLIKLFYVLTLLLLGFLCLKKRKKTEIKTLVYMTGLIVCFAVISNNLANKIPPIMDNVTITALGEKNEASNSEEIWLCDFLINGQKFQVDKPIDGKWFWANGVYMWRPENDNSQPNGTTRSWL